MGGCQLVARDGDKEVVTRRCHGACACVLVDAGQESQVAGAKRWAAPRAQVLPRAPGTPAPEMRGPSWRPSASRPLSGMPRS